MATSYQYWEQALLGNFLPIHDGDAQPGYYRKRTGKAAGYAPVALWEQDGAMVGLLDGKEADPAELWSWVADKPISEEHYLERMETGRWWDEDEAVTESLSPGAGHNNGPTDPAEELKESIDSALKGVYQYEEITDDVTAQKAQSLRSRLLELSGDADKKRETEKAPHLEAGRLVDAKYQPLVKSAKAGADAIRSALGAHETRKDNARKAEEAARLKALREAEAVRAKGLEAGKPAPKLPPLPAAPPPEPAPTKLAGAYGRAASIKTIKVATVTDRDAAYQGLRDHKEMVELIAKLAQRAADAGITLPGVVIEERKDVR